MTQEQPSALMERQHRQIDTGIKAVIDGDGSYVALAKSLQLLYLHIYVEEQHLFPPLETFGITMPVFVMKKEHAEMWPYMQELDAACARKAPLADMQRTALALFRLLQVHNPKEEEVVYTAADRLVTETPQPSWLAALQSAEMPEGWVCALAGSAS